MFYILKIFLLWIFIYFFLLYLIDDDNLNSLIYKLYLFLFVFIIEFVIQIFESVIVNPKEHIVLSNIVQNSINTAYIATIVNCLYSEMVYNNFYKNYTKYQKISLLTLLIISFIVAVKFIEYLFIIN